MEMGSEFSANSSRRGRNEYVDLCRYPKRYVLSGRTGLHIIAGELSPAISRIWMPDYCCGSMIAPFVAQGFQVSFYAAFEWEQMEIDANAGAVLIMDYFGYLSEQTVAFARRCKEAGMTVIADATQTAFSRSTLYDMADFVVCSYRKWLDCLCAVVYSKNGFRHSSETDEHPAYNETWRKAATLKERYIRTGEGDKQEFLNLYARANHELSESYMGYAANAAEVAVMESADSAFIRTVRRENACYLMEQMQKLSETSDVQLLFDTMGTEDCPLFVPILLNVTHRTAIRGELTANGIYCPVHWPIDGRYPYEETAYHKQELSLLCDQRYGMDEMKRQVSVLAHALAASETSH